jgi:two-component system sensor histidine kinase YesM
MTAEQIENIFSETSNDKSQFFKEIGLININKRIKYEFGDEYGIFIESELAKYTRMIVKIKKMEVDKCTKF